jgi:hypothetical protein
MVLTLIVEAARRGSVERRLEEFGSDPVLTIACLGLIGVSLLWVFLSPAIYRNLRKRAEQATKRVRKPEPPRDIWKAPPR